MKYGYFGATPSQVKFNNGIYSVSDVNELTAKGNFGGKYEHIETITVSGATTNIIFSNIAEDKYDEHVVLADKVSGTATNRVNCQLSSDGGSSYYTTGYQRAVYYRNHTGSDTGTYGNTNENAIWYSVGTDNSSNAGTTGAYLKFFNLGSNSHYSSAIADHCGNNTNNNTNYLVSASYSLPNTNVINTIKFFAYSSTLDQGIFRLYGIKRGVV